jgi:parallel beta-helix repeat protein
MVCGFLILFGWSPPTATAAPLALTVSGPIVTTTAWTLADSPVIISGTVTVSTGTLTIDPGVQVLFNTDAELIIQTSGRLISNGTSGQPILFSSNVGPASCNWKTIRMFSDDNSIQYSRIEYARWGIYAEPFSGGHLIRNNIFYKNALCASSPVGAAIAGSPDDTEMSSNTFTDNGSAIYLTKSSGNLIFGNTISGTTVAAIAFIRSGSTNSSNNQIYGNTIHASQAEGIFLDLGFQNAITTNLIYSNSSDGLKLTEQTNAKVEDNIIYTNNNDGLDNGPNNTNPLGTPSVAGNVICRNTPYQLRHAGPTTLIAEGNWWGTNTP